MFVLPLLVAVFFAIRYFQLKSQVTRTSQELEDILLDMSSNRMIKLDRPHKVFESLLCTLNKYMDQSRQTRISYEKKSQAIKNDMEHISHDLRTPLTSIQGYIQLMDESESLEEMASFKRIALSKAKALEGLLANFYEYAVIDEKKDLIKYENIDVKKILSDKLLMFYEDFESQSIDVTVDLPHEKIELFLDSNYTERILYNLIQNATKYSSTLFEVTLKKVSDQVYISFVNDMETNDLELDKLFDRFYMADQTRNSDSSGLGLTITKKLVELQGGRITVEIEDNQIIFTVLFKS